MHTRMSNILRDVGSSTDSYPDWESCQAFDPSPSCYLDRHSVYSLHTAVSCNWLCTRCSLCAYIFAYNVSRSTRNSLTNLVLRSYSEQLGWTCRSWYKHLLSLTRPQAIQLISMSATGAEGNRRTRRIRISLLPPLSGC